MSISDTSRGDGPGQLEPATRADDAPARFKKSESAGPMAESAASAVRRVSAVSRYAFVEPVLDKRQDTWLLANVAICGGVLGIVADDPYVTPARKSMVSPRSRILCSTGLSRGDSFGWWNTSSISSCRVRTIMPWPPSSATSGCSSWIHGPRIEPDSDRAIPIAYPPVPRLDHSMRSEPLGAR